MRHEIVMKTGLGTGDFIIGTAAICGAIIWAPPHAVGTLQSYAHELLNSSTKSEYIKAENAATAPATPLQPQQLQELLEGIRFLIREQYEKAVPILSKYAHLGDARAQGMMGNVYYFGLGLPQDRSQALLWFRLAANQGSPSDLETFSEAAKGTLIWDGPTQQQTHPSLANVASDPLNSSSPALAENNSNLVATAPLASYQQSPGGLNLPPIGARASVNEAYGNDPVRRIGAAEMPSSRRVEDQTILNRAGPNNFSDQNGDTYTRAGPHGVINNRTGQFSPTN